MAEGDTTKQEIGGNPAEMLGADQEPLFIDSKNKDYLTREELAPSEEQRNKISCDEVLAIYLTETAQKVTPEYYKVILRFVLSYRECLNRYGWEKKAENDEILNNTGNCEDMETTMITPASQDIIEKAENLKKKCNGKEFSVINNAEHAPEICNEFVTIY